jgi:hypothetical protein
MQLSENQLENIHLLFDTIFHVQKLADKYNFLDNDAKEIAKNILPVRDSTQNFLEIESILTGLEVNIRSLYNRYLSGNPVIDIIDVKLVMLQTGKNFKDCYHALLKNNGDIVDSIMALNDVIIVDDPFE